MFRVSARERIEEGGSVLIGTMSTMALVFTVCVLFSPIVNSEPECALLYFTRAVCPWTPVVSTGSEQVWWGGDSACPMACNRDSSGAPIECLASEVLLHTHNLTAPVIHIQYKISLRGPLTDNVDNEGERKGRANTAVSLLYQSCGHAGRLKRGEVWRIIKWINNNIQCYE